MRNTEHSITISYTYEELNIGNRLNCVFTLLHNYLETSLPIDNLILFPDNCVGQNKNNAVLHYLLCRVEKGKHTRILLNFLLTEHTKFTPDRLFGVLKSKCAATNIDTYDGLIKCIAASLELIIISYTKYANSEYRYFDTIGPISYLMSHIHTFLSR